MSTAEQDALRQQTDKRLRRALEACRTKSFCRIDSSQGPAWAAIGPEYSFDPVATAVPEARLRSLADALTTVPPGFHIHPKLARILSGKAEVFRDQGRLDWAMAEALAFGSLLLEGHPVRLSGQDSTRGTFSQRHLAWWDTESSQPKAYVPLDALAPDQARLQVHDSPLSEYSILGFEYGYSLVHPATLVIWEAQFGDFCNGAQVVIDNYIASAERKWGRRSGLVLLLPHGCEGQGPDHSSGHLSRFLQLCAEGNLQVCNLTTPAQYFHLLRHQVMCGYRKPLVLMTPKSLLRHPRAVSSVSALATGGFTRVLPDTTVEAAAARRVLLCSGKVYYDLLEHRAKAQPVGVAIVRLEQLYPLDVAGLRQALAPCAAARDVVWVQEEPRNLGAWGFLRERLAGEWPKLALRYVGRPESATSASGRATQHKREQEALVGEAFAP
jgi:2-oxoglutarate dehydrogenase E1 component